MYPGLSKDFPEPDAQTHQVAEHAENPCAAPTHETSNDPSQSSGSVPSDAGPMEICQDRWPFDWSTVDVPGSPGLSRLFSALEIEAKTFVPPLSLETPESEDSRCLSNVEILVLTTSIIYTYPETGNVLHLLGQLQATIHTILGGTSTLYFSGMLRVPSTKSIYSLLPTPQLARPLCLESLSWKLSN
jgi:hypothetical protein